MLRRLLGSSFTFDIVPAADLHNVRADRSQLQQILMNLVVNARDAMPAGGAIVIETANVAFETEDRNHPLAGAPCARITVSDDGPGIAVDALPHIFEPFFTTKEAGRGTGLGLATVYGIVRQHDGHLVVRSEPGQGAQFEVYFPAVDEELDERPEIGGHDRRRTGTETVLVVEDEDAVREVTSRVLRSRGYTVVEASNPEEAQGVFEGQPIDLLVTDVVMPGGDGPSLFLALSRLDSNLRVIYMSGYADPAGIGDVAALGAPFLRKPFAPDQLVRMVRDCLDA
jgi:CheY-like chemotaxis protein